jgi:hypothetical protein
MSGTYEMTVREFVDQHSDGYFRSVPLADFDRWFVPKRFKSLLDTRMRTDRTGRRSCTGRLSVSRRDHRCIGIVERH